MRRCFDAFFIRSITFFKIEDCSLDWPDELLSSAYSMVQSYIQYYKIFGEGVSFYPDNFVAVYCERLLVFTNFTEREKYRALR